MTETWDQITRRHKAEKRAVMEALAAEGITQTVAAKRLNMSLTGLNNFVIRENIHWPVIQQGPRRKTPMTALTLTTRASLRPARYDDMFASDEDYAAKAREIVRRQLRAPIDARKATRVTPVQPGAMIATAPRHNPNTRWYLEAPKVPAKSANRGNQAKRDTANNRVLSILDRPMTASEIAEATGMKREGVRIRIQRMAEAGLIKAHATVPVGHTRTMTTQWVRA